MEKCNFLLATLAIAFFLNNHPDLPKEGIDVSIASFETDEGFTTLRDGPRGRSPILMSDDAGFTTLPDGPRGRSPILMPDDAGFTTLPDGPRGRSPILMSDDAGFITLPDGPRGRRPIRFTHSESRARSKPANPKPFCHAIQMEH